MSRFRTVRGEVQASSLGVTLCHEHLVLDASPEQRLTVEDVASDLQDLARHGGQAVVELTNEGMGRDVRGLRVLSEMTGLHVICATGLYKQSHYPSWVRDASVEALAERFAAEVEEGIEDSGVRAGVIGEIGTSEEWITPDEEKVLRAAARAALATGAPLSTHTSFGRLALEQLDIIAEEGLPAHRVSVGHLDLVPDPDYHTAVAERGAFVEYDTFGKAAYQADKARSLCLVEMLRRGFADQILLSCDITRTSYLKRRGGWGYAHLLEAVVPELGSRGVGDAVVQKLLVDNPARFLAFERPGLGPADGARKRRGARSGA